jgi:two-component system response regulator PilR (NtrC family)
MRLGAASFIEKPANPEHLAALIKDAMTQAQLRREYERLKGEGCLGFNNDLSGVSAAVVKLRDEIAFAASTTQPVLLLGETGTGKSLLAKLIHQASHRSSRRLVHYHPNYAGGDIVQSELFGHKKGAFTGAVDSRRGLVLEGDGGTLFIDELDSVPLDTQVLLLDLVQEQRIRPVGSDAYQKIDCRIIAATNRPIAEALKEGLIRQDLYHRLASNVIPLPPLRDRREDIPPLAELFVRRFASENNKRIAGISREAMDTLMKYSYPGNVRELENVLERALAFSNGEVINVEDLGLRPVVSEFDAEEREEDDALPAAPAPGLTGSAMVDGIPASLPDYLDQIEREAILRALDKTRYNRTAAARLLGITFRALRYRMQRLEIS